MLRAMIPIEQFMHQTRHTSAMSLQLPDMWLSRVLASVPYVGLVIFIVKGLRPCHPLPVACGLRSATCSAIGHGAPAHAPAWPHWVGSCHCALRPLVLGAATDLDDCVCVVGTLLSVCRRSVTVGTQISK